MLLFALICSNAIGFALQLVLPLVVLPSVYSKYSLIISISQSLLILFFEWIRLPLLRYAASGRLSARVRLAGDYFVIYSGLCMVLAVTGFSLLTFDLFADIEKREIVALVLILVSFQAAFEGAQSYSRAHCLDRKYANLWILRSFLTLTLCLAFGYIFESSEWVVLGYILSFALVLVYGYLRGFGTVKLRWSGAAGKYFIFGLLLTAASFATSVFVPIYKAFFLDGTHAQDAGSVFWLLDVFSKIFLIIAMAVNIVISQKIIRALQKGNSDRATSLTFAQITGVLFFVLPFLIVVIFSKEIVFSWFVPVNYLNGVRDLYFPIVVATALLAIKMFVVDALFIVYARGLISFASTAVAIVIWLCIAGFRLNGAIDLSWVLVWILGGVIISSLFFVDITHFRCRFASVVLGLVAANVCFVLVGLFLNELMSFDGLFLLLLLVTFGVLIFSVFAYCNRKTLLDFWGALRAA